MLNISYLQASRRSETCADYIPELHTSWVQITERWIEISTLVKYSVVSGALPTRLALTGRASGEGGGNGTEMVLNWLLSSFRCDGGITVAD